MVLVDVGIDTMFFWNNDALYLIDRYQRLGGTCCLETYVIIYQITRCHISEDRNLSTVESTLIKPIILSVIRCLSWLRKMQSKYAMAFL
jgi:hypothetical protein